MELPSLAARSTLSYDWDGYKSVTLFSSDLPFSEFRDRLSNGGFTRDTVLDAEDSLQYHFLEDDGETKRFELIAAMVGADDEGDLGIMSYIGQDHFSFIDLDTAATIGALFERSTRN
ncbi:MAG: hypothetical protein P1V20_25360 [Verrucomicrobiales bacterium]|nr:hypothetical protein [Verrucomicrobiales bacterium]